MAALRPWVILRRDLCLVTKDGEEEVEADEHPAATISTTVLKPPQVTVLDVAVAPGAYSAPKRPFLVATGRSALLLCFIDGPVPIATDDLFLVREFIAPGPGDEPHQPITAPAERVPRRTAASSMPVTYDIRSVGLVIGLFGGYRIAELQVTRGSNRAKLFGIVSADYRFGTGGSLFNRNDEWYETDVVYPLHAEDREWSPSGVIAHDNKLWWFDLGWGLLSCDPDTLVPHVLRFHDLPPGCDCAEARPFPDAKRCICVSQNMLRYVGYLGEMKVVMWTLIPTSGGDGDDTIEYQWHESCQMDFTDLWNDESYKATGLPAEVPDIALVCPRNHNAVYFFLNGIFFCVEVPLRRIVHCAKDCPQLVASASRHSALPAWHLPNSTDDDLAEATVPVLEESGSSSSSASAGETD